MLTISQLSKKLNIAAGTLRRWEREGKITSFRTEGGHRRYDENQFVKNLNQTNTKKTIAYARVSTKGQNKDLERQVEMLSLYCSSKGYNFTLIQDFGSGINYKKKGLLELIKMIDNNEVERIVLTNRDRLIRFGYELIYFLCELKNVEIEIINDNHHLDSQSEFVNDVVEIITVFSSKLYGSRSHQNKNSIDKIKQILDDK